MRSELKSKRLRGVGDWALQVSFHHSITVRITVVSSGDGDWDMDGLGWILGGRVCEKSLRAYRMRSVRG